MNSMKINNRFPLINLVPDLLVKEGHEDMRKLINEIDDFDEAFLSPLASPSRWGLVDTTTLESLKAPLSF